MDAIIPARIKPGSIDHVPFPTIVSCHGTSLALREMLAGENARCRREREYETPKPENGVVVCLPFFDGFILDQSRKNIKRKKELT
ncbi:hypothetical protein LIER_11008 [Lithospermum erythrorhizon]|uniref:Uncharacterized protein n=1 Tax=Lithospermum erythrorhizon TaxID=34254 RepID=A0AAV3PMQ2_LITER